MLKHVIKWSPKYSPSIFHPLSFSSISNTHNSSILFIHTTTTSSPPAGALILEARHVFRVIKCNARRRAIRDDGDSDEEDDEYGFNEEIAMLEAYTQSVKDEVLLVEATVDEEQVQVIIFKGFSSCLSYQTSPDPTRSVIPARAVIKSIDRLRGPFDPSDIQYIEKGLTFDTFKNRLRHQQAY